VTRISETSTEFTVECRVIDETIARWTSAGFESKYKGKLSGNPMDHPKSRRTLMPAAENEKKTLSPSGVKEASSRQVWHHTKPINPMERYFDQDDIVAICHTSQNKTA
jgi:hypothetical protein